MLIAEVKGFFGLTYEFLETVTVVGRLKLSGWRERASIEIDETGGVREYRLQRAGTFSGAFLLLEAERVIAYAEKPSIFSTRFELALDGQQYRFRRPSLWSQRFELEKNGVTVGSVVPRGFFRRRFEIDLPEELPLVIRVFIFWLAVVIWKRQQAAAAS